MPLPAMLTFNELNGEEVREILENRCRDIFSQVPQFQRHITLPRVKITLHVKLEIYADQPNPETMNIGDRLTVVVEQPAEVFIAESVDASAPIPGGHPPDQVREMHGLPISQPSRGPRDVGAQIMISDQPAAVSGRDAQQLQGVKITRDESQTTITLDQGPAGLRYKEMNREPLRLSRGVPPEKRIP